MEEADKPAKRGRGAPKGSNIGNKHSSLDNRMWRNAIRRAVIQGQAGDQPGQVLREIADKLVDMARGGDINAMREIGDRLDGKAVQSTEISGPDGGPVEVAQRPQVTKEEWLALHGVGTAAGTAD